MMYYISQMVPPTRTDAAIWVAEFKSFEKGLQVSRPSMENSLNAGGEIWTSENYV